MRGHAVVNTNNHDLDLPINGGSNDLPEAPYLITLSPPGGWESWKPATEPIEFTALADLSHPGEASVSFHLSGVTSHEGRYMNDLTQKGDTTSPDLHFAPAEEQDQTLYPDANGISQITWSGGGKDSTFVTASWQRKPSHDGIVIPVKIVCNDYAAYGEIHAKLHVPNYKPKPTEPQTIPKDDGISSSTLEMFNPDDGSWYTVPVFGGVADNKLADGWDADHYYWCEARKIAMETMGMSAMTMGMSSRITSMFSDGQTGLDRDEGYNRSGANSGDGLTVFEEYRGFMIGGSHERLNPEVKDLFIRSEINETDGVGETGNAYGFGLSVHSIKADECFIDTENPSDPVVNFCMGGSLTAVWVVEPATEDERAEIGDGTLGFHDPGTKRCVIGVDAANASITFSLSSVIGHEVGHAIGLEHHWPRTDKRVVPSSNPLSISLPVVVLDFPTENTDACTMMTLENTKHMSYKIRLDINSRWSNEGWADFHNTPPDGGTDWEDHWHKYRLHGGEGHLTYD